MASHSKINEKLIAETCGQKALERGLEYYKQNRVKNVTVFGNVVKSTVIGSNRYTVEIKLDGENIEGRCTCPVEDSCKHVAATLFFLKDKGSITTKIEDIESYLNSLSKDDLTRLILDAPSESMLKAIKFDMVARKKSKLDVASYEEELRSALALGHYFDYNETFSLVADLKDVKGNMEKIIDLGFYNEACRLLLEFLKGCIQKEEECDDSNGDVGELTIDAGSLLAKALKGANADEVILQELVKIYKDAADYGLEDAIHNAIKGLDRTKLKTLESLVTARKESEFKCLYREIVNLQGRHEEYIEMCCESKEYAEAVEKLQELGRIDDAIKLAEEKSRNDSWLLEKLFELLLAKGSIGEALSCAWKIFKNEPWEDNLKRIKETSIKLGVWKSEKSRAMAFLELSGKNKDLLVLLCLEEGDLKRALKNTKDIGEETAAKLASALENKMPEAAIEIYMKLVRSNVERTGNDRYKIAAGYLQKMKRIHSNTGEEKRWEAYIADLREVHKAKRNFVAAITGL